MSDADMDAWHLEFESRTPEAHQDFLESLGLRQPRSAVSERPPLNRDIHLPVILFDIPCHF